MFLHTLCLKNRRIKKLHLTILEVRNKPRHSDDDTLDSIKPESMETCGKLMVQFIKRLDESLI